MPAISIMLKPVSGSCNMHCDYCFYSDEAGKRECASYGVMSLETLKNVISKTLSKAEGYYSIGFQGGEPTLIGLPFYQEVMKLLRAYNSNNCRIQVALQTNGYGIDDKWAEFLAKNHILTGLSIDGIAEIHNKYRHGNKERLSYEKNLEVAKLFDQYGVEYNILTVVHREVAEHIEEIYQNYKEHGWHYQQYISCLDPLDEQRGKQEYSLTPELYGTFLVKLFNLWYEDAKKSNAPYIRQFENYIVMMMGMRPESCDMGGCCGKNYVVEADGSVFPCDFYVLDHMKLGNFNNNGLKKIDQKREEIGFIKQSMNHAEKCRGCQWFNICRGGCYRSRFTAQDEMRGDGNEGLNYFCPAYKVFFEQCYDKMRLIAREAMRHQ